MRYPFPRWASRAILALSCAVAGGCQSLMGDAMVPWRIGANVVNHTSLSLGARATDLDTSLGDSSQIAVGLEVDWLDPDAVLGYEAGYVFAHESDIDFHEGYAGLRRTWLRPGFKPYVGAGLSYLSVNPDKGITDFDSWGGYAHVGGYWPLRASLFSFGLPATLGFDLRGLAGDHATALEARVLLGFGSS